MKANFTEQYYKDNFERCIKETKIDLEADLEQSINFLDGTDLPEEAIEKVKAVYAKKIAEKFKEELIKRMQVIKNVESGNASFGYVTEAQEVKARFEYRRYFEFGCYYLAVFKKKYNIQ